MAKLSYLDAILQAQDIAMEKDENVFILGEDVGVKGGVFGATKGLQEKYGVERVIDTPLAESNIVGTAIGASALGKRPIAEIQFADFILPATNQIISEAAKCAIDPIMIGIVLSQFAHLLVEVFMVVCITRKASKVFLLQRLD